MRYFHYFYEAEIKGKSGMGLAEVWNIDQFDKLKVIQDVEKEKQK